MPNSIADESYDNWRSLAPGMSITDCEMLFWGGIASLSDRKLISMPTEGSMGDQELAYWKSRAVFRGLSAALNLSVSDFKLFAQIQGG